MKTFKMSGIILVLLSQSLNAQIIDPSKEVDWAVIESPMTNEEKLTLVAEINEDLFYYLKDNNLLEENIKDFHFLDLNGDEKLDFIYVGYAGGEQPSTLAFTQKNKGYFTRSFEAIGTIYEVNTIGLVEGALMFRVLKNDGCYDCLGVRTSTTYLNVKGVFTEVENLSFTEKTEIPKAIFKKQFKVINEKYYLRSTSVVSNEGKGPDVLFGNVVAEYTKGVIGSAFASKEDDTGRVWWFVAIKGNESTQSIYSNKDSYYLGWMSSRYLEEL